MNSSKQASKLGHINACMQLGCFALATRDEGGIYQQFGGLPWALSLQLWQPLLEDELFKRAGVMSEACIQPLAH